jgi:outer membrane translocation and assembly module TamA
VAGQLGAGPEGGLRRWESSVELRLRLGRAFGVVLFYDMGDVSRGKRFRFARFNPAAGFGFRYLTVIGAIRADLAFRLQRTEDESTSLLLFGQPGAMHLTLGEAF